MRKNLLQLLLFLFVCSSVYAQTSSLRGVAVNVFTKIPIAGVTVSLKDTEKIVVTSFDGSFLFENVSLGENWLVFSSLDIITKELQVNVLPGETTDIGEVLLTTDVRTVLNESSLMLLEEEALTEDADQSDFSTSALLTSSNDVYVSNTSYNFSAMRFKVRGYGNRYSDVYIGGVNFNDAERGGFSYGMIGGLNDATRNKDMVNAYDPSSFGFGQIGGATNIIANASNYSPGTKLGIAYTNRMYKIRGTAIHSTGLMDNGWAFTASAGYRWSDEGYVDGTFYNSLGLFFSAEKVFNKSHSLSFVGLMAPTQRAQQGASVQEIYDLMGDNLYNPNWGYQNGKKRNARVVTLMDPTVVVSHVWNMNENTKLTTGLGFKYSIYGSTALNWINAADPRPDYYKYLPSYQSSQENKDKWATAWRTNPAISQIDWDGLYQQNYQAPRDSGSIYMVEERRNDQLSLTLNSVLTTKLNERVTFSSGLQARTTKGMHYKLASDLMGGEFIFNKNQFAARDFGWDAPQVAYDLNNPDQKVYKGDRFGYDYDIYVNSASVWMQNVHNYRKWDVYYGFKIDYSDFYRHGHMRNGLSPNNSYGKGQTHSFVDQTVKLGLAYKITGRHMISGNFSYGTLPPLAYNAYLSSRVKDDVLPNLKSERVLSGDVSYYLNLPQVRGRVTAYQTNFYDQSELHNMYYDEDNSYVNFVLSGVEKIHRGFELGIEYKLNPSITFSVAGTISEYFYNNRPTGTISYENGSRPDQTGPVYLKNFYEGGTPQTAGTFGIHYFHPKYWFLDLNINGFDRTYLDFSPFRRSVMAYAGQTGESLQEKLNRMQSVTDQEKFGGGATVDISIGKIIRIQRKYNLNLNLQFCNILNNTDLKTGGYEQARIDTGGSISKFPSKYYYAQGFNCFLNAGFRF